jgi:FkbM family methyltransferase
MLTDYAKMIQKNNLKIDGVVHLGASIGHELNQYIVNGAKKIIFVEAIPSIYQQLLDNTKNHPNVTCFNACLSDVDGQEVEFNISSNDALSSSFLDFDQHSKEHPSVTFVDKLKLTTRRMDTIIEENKVNINEFNYLSLDLQGAELHALKGIQKYLKNFEYIYCEVSERPMYKGQPLIGDIDNYLSANGFKRVEYFPTNHGWGEALYVKNHDAKIVPVPEQFRPLQPFPYPSGNYEAFEEWFFKNANPEEINGRVYLPIFWTSYYRRTLPYEPLDNYLRSLDRSKKYFTIIQYDDGIMNDISFLDIKVFAMSGERVDYPLPLIAQQHPNPWTKTDKTIFANFIGSNTHRIRENIVNKYSAKKDWYVNFNKHDETSYRDIIAQSTFTLCPRGYGKTSFRIMEALEHGSIPVYISDSFIIPHNYDFNKYGVTIHSDEIHLIDKILETIPREDIERKRYIGKAVFTEMYTYDGCKSKILSNI